MIDAARERISIFIASALRRRTAGLSPVRTCLCRMVAACSRRNVSIMALNSRLISRSFSFLRSRICTRVAAASRAILAARARSNVRFASKARALACRKTALVSCCAFSALRRCSLRRRHRRRKHHSGASRCTTRPQAQAPSKATVPTAA